MRIFGFVLLAALTATPALARESAMPRPDEMHWQCGRMLSSGAGTGFDFTLRTEAGARARFSAAPDGAMASLLGVATRTRGAVAIGYVDVNGTRRAQAVEIGSAASPCWRLRQQGRRSYEQAYDQALRAAPAPSPKLKPAKIERLKTWK